MFKKLKEKITEEVKSSPQRFADFTQSVSDKLQNNSSSEDNFFSIGDDDSSTPTNSAEQGFASVALVSPTQETRGRRDSNSSLASDVSFLPRYESGSMYHLQSDLDISTSELEDNASTASSQIGHLTKEQIYSAFQKSQMRYHKYRGRYTDLARHYKELERENAKMKSVLVETQDKAIRRIHTLQTKIQLLQGGEHSDLLVNIDGKENQTENLDNLTKYLNDARKEIEALNEKIQEMKANVIVFQSKEQEYKTKIGNLERDIAQYSERKKENNLKLAENKMDLHNELLNKDAEISDLKKDNETLRQKLEVVEAENKISGGTKLENLQSQNTKLIDKVESLTLKCNNLESELLKVEQYKIEIKELREKEAILLKELFDFKNENCDLKDSLSKERKDFENQITAIREDAKKGLLSLEPKIREKLQNEHLQKEEELKREFAKRIEEVSSQKDAQLLLFERDDQIKTLNEELDVVKQELSKKIDEYSDLERNHLELIEDCSQLRNTIESLEKEKSSLESSQEKNQSHITTLQEELKEIEEIARHKEKENVYLSQENLNLQQELTETSQKLRIFEEKYEAIQLESSESKMLELKLQKLEGEKQELLEEFESERKIFNGMLEDNKELREKEQLIIELRQDLDNIRHEMGHLNENLRLEREKNVMLYDKKHHLELEVDTLQEKVRIFEEKTEAQEMDSPECGLLKLQVQNLEKENKMLQESFEHERLTFADELDNIKRDMSTNELRDIVKVWEDQTLRHTPVDELRIKLHDIRRLAESKEKENVYLAEENLKLQQENRKVSESLRLLEEKLESIQLESGESKLLELKVQQLEEENSRHAREFEMERKMYNNLLENDKELKIKEELIARLNENLKTSHQEVIKLEEILQAEKEENVLLGKQKLSLEQQVEKLTEQVRIAEEKDEAIVMDVNECNLLEMKLSKLEEENKSLEESFELERKCFNKSYEEHARNEAKLKTLLEENYKIKELVKKEKENVEKLSKYLKDKENEQKRTEDQYMQSLKKIDRNGEENQNFEKENESSLKKLETLNRENEELRKEVAGKEGQVAELSKNIANLSEVIQKQTKEFNSLLERTQQLETVLARIQTDSAEAIKKEKERQNELTLKIKELQRDLDEKTEKLAGLSEQLAKVEKQYTEEKHNYESKSREIDSLHKKIAELQAVEESYKMIGEEKRVIDNELPFRVKKIDLENKLKQVESEFKSKNNEVVQKFKVSGTKLRFIERRKAEFVRRNRRLTE
ncbi:hypothetical protein NQ317_005046 [Molorchus minor]|uniref:Golgin subfamily A member 4 n=1 Tax=Molorchus minor TaxID=1323400 RepID=A0ABQ9JWL5_9CUCU|nr:hypothetical protein NQ317_005046 [Molorchus minor]